jgi:peptidoglycan/xylan/chitin deacetylase (PgdA/CDA1 family)
VAEGLAVGSHTRTHPALPALTETQLRGEILGAHADLERELGGAVPVFSYPYGITDARAVPTLRELGYLAAFISLLGRNAVGQRDPFLLYRHSVDIQDSLTSLAMSLTSTYVRVRESGRAAKARVLHSLSR